MKHRAITIRDVADLAEVSIATVSHVVNKSRRITPKTQARVENAIQHLNYVINPAGRALALARNGASDGSSVTSQNHSIIWPAIEASPARNLRSSSSPSVLSRERTVSKHHHDEDRLDLKILKIIRASQPVSRVAIAKKLGVGRCIISEKVNPLIAAGDIVECAPRKEGLTGRPAKGLSFTNNHQFFLGVSIGPTSIKLCAETAGGIRLIEESLPTQSDPELTFRQIRNKVIEIVSCHQGRKLTHIGVTVPGYTNRERTKLIYSPYLRWQNINVSEQLFPGKHLHSTGSELMIPNVIVESSAIASAVYESRRLLHRQEEEVSGSFIAVNVDEQIGIAMVMEGEPFRGTKAARMVPNGFGHMTVMVGGKLCLCGNRGCWEMYASTKSASSLYDNDERQTRDVARATSFAEIARRASAGERRATSTLEKVGQYLGMGISNVVSGMGILKVVVSGEIIFGWKFIEPALLAAVSRTLVGKLPGFLIRTGVSEGGELSGAIEVAVSEYLKELTRKRR